jgi:beta-galactosidase
MKQKILGRETPVNSAWVFHEEFKPSHLKKLAKGKTVALPHTAVEVPFSYFDERAYQKSFCYQRMISWQAGFAGREVTLRFDGAMADAKVWINGVEVAAHRDGYTPFEARLTPHLKHGKNLVTVKIDGSENPDIPPFGGVIDYLTYAGIYRDVWLVVTPVISLGNTKIETPGVMAERKSVTVAGEIANPQAVAFMGKIQAQIVDAKGRKIASASTTVEGSSYSLSFSGLENITLWDIDNPALYKLELEIETHHGKDAKAITFGFRHAEFTAGGFFLNGRELKIRGLNRHQSFPYVGYAMGRRAQERDAEILKHELRCNLVRTAHYPQSPWFLDHCDRIGLLVFGEIPGWQHIGGADWKDEAVENVRRMLRRDWNHPSIVIWGVRINESQDDHEFYARTNAVARELDKTRQTGGVRYITESELLEDVYTMNDFILGQEERTLSNRGRVALRDQQEVTGLKHNVPYLVTEFGGHMFPTKRHDQEQRQAEHVTRNLQILEAAHADPHISGCIGWCFADYNTHKDFGSGDRICHHGMLDMFRVPKFAAHVWATQGRPDRGNVLEPVTFFARGERNIGGVLPLIVLTNCDEVELRYGPHVIKRAVPDRQTYPHLPHAPVVFDERVFSPEELGAWGMRWHDAEVRGFVDGKLVMNRQFSSQPVPVRLDVVADETMLSDEAKDSTRIVARALDQAGNILPFFAESIEIAVTGKAKLLGPAAVPLRGGVAGFWVETVGGSGAATIRVKCPRMKDVRLTLHMHERGRLP